MIKKNNCKKNCILLNSYIYIIEVTNIAQKRMLVFD